MSSFLAFEREGVGFDADALPELSIKELSCDVNDNVVEDVISLPPASLRGFCVPYREASFDDMAAADRGT